MAKNTLTLIIFCFLTSVSSSQIIGELSVASINENASLEVTLTTDYYNYFEFMSFDYTITGDNIQLRVCYLPFDIPTVTSNTDVFELELNNSDSMEYTLEVELHISNNSDSCDYAILTDSDELVFTNPIDDPVVLTFPEMAPFEGFTLFPNPAKETLWINGNAAMYSNLLYEITFLNGQTVRSGNIAFDNTRSVDLSELVAGTYFLMLVNEGDGNSRVFKFVKD